LTARPAKPKAASKKTLAAQADPHALYERAVQDPASDVKFFTKIFRKLRGHDPVSLREDFCGTAVLCKAWAESSPERTAVGVDLSQETINWGLENRIVPAGRDVASRISLICGDVRDVRKPKVDVACALNFSYYCFKQRQELLDYFRAVHAGLGRDGVFFMDLLGGTEAISEGSTDNDLGTFIYRWEQAKFDALTHDFVCHIHFLFPDGSKLLNAYTYDWRLWMPPELRDILLEAGFSNVRFYWEKTNAEGEATGSFYEPDYVENQEIWWTYLAAER
jgi:hypothetical protein